MHCLRIQLPCFLQGGPLPPLTGNLQPLQEVRYYDDHDHDYGYDYDDLHRRARKGLEVLEMFQVL